MTTANPSNPQIQLASYMTRSPHAIGVDQSVASARALMHKHDVRHLPVLSGGELVGVVSERDLTMIEALPGIDTHKLAVEEAMSATTYAVPPETPLAEVAAAMAEHKYGCAVAMQHGRVIGILTTVDVCRALAGLLGAAGRQSS